MDQSYEFFIEGRPRPKERARTRRDGRSYTPKRTAEWEERIKQLYDGPMFLRPVLLDLVFTTEGTQVSITQAEWSSPLTADIDNLCKLVQDGLQGVAYENDRLVVGLNAEKA